MRHVAQRKHVASFGVGGGGGKALNNTTIASPIIKDQKKGKSEAQSPLIVEGLDSL